jgi:phthalate 4,5-cis-dihydrodiol dehydrogenase
MDDQRDKARQMLKIGIVGLGNAASMIMPALKASGDAVLAGAADIRVEARAKVAETYGVPAVATIEELVRCDLDAVWIATPNQFHADQAVAAANAGKHVICEKPMALSLAECDRMIGAAAANGVKLLLGHSKLAQAPVRKMREILTGGMLGRVIQIATWNYNDWLQRPRLRAEVDTEEGGGICYRQAPHQVDIIRYLVGKPAQTIRGFVHRADPSFPTEGDYTALLSFEGGTPASLVYNAYGYFDISELTWNIGEGGRMQRPRYGGKRASGAVTPEIRYAKREATAPGERHQPFYGLTIVSCERGVIRQSPDGIFIYDASGCREVACDDQPSIHRDVAELAAAIAEQRAPFPDGAWGKATLEICLGLLESAASGRDVTLRYQG